MNASKVDAVLVPWSRRLEAPLARLAILVVYTWFGVLKLFDASPANPIVSQLLERTLPFISFERFIVLLGLFEMAIGIAFAIPKLEKLALAMVVPHLIMTSGPLVFLPTIAWKSFPVPTLEGQYIIKNLLIAAAAVAIVAKLRPAEQAAPAMVPASAAKSA